MVKQQAYIFTGGFLTALCLVLVFWLATKPQRSIETKNFEKLCGSDIQQGSFICAMHPAVQRINPGNCPICGMALTPNPNLHPGESPWVQIPVEYSKRIGVQTTVVKPTHGSSISIPVNGTIAIDKNRMYRQTSRLPGRIERLFIRNAGEQIVAGQPIASIYSRELIAVVEAYAYNNTSESVLRSAKNNLAAWGLPEEQVKEMLHRDDYRVPVDITADFSGTVLEVLVREGDHAANTHMGAPTVLFEVADLSKVWAIADIRVPDLDHISIGSRIQFQASGHSENQFSASIDWISPVVDSETGILKVRATIPNRYGHLKPGMEFSGHILASSKAEGFKVPASAVLWTGKHSFVYVKGNEFSGGDFYSIREIELGRKLNDDFYFVTDGLELGDEVVVNGAFQIDAQAQLSGKPSMMMPQQGRREETPHLEERELANDLRSHQTAR